MSDTPKEKIVCGYPETEFTFTGEYAYGAAGYRKASRNKTRYRIPEYRADDGQKIYDATQKEYLK